jgi:glycosyltransferase involved in cell wall biosynthesis
MAVPGDWSVLVATSAARTAETSASVKAIRLLTLSTLFPNACEPRRGIFIANRLARLCGNGRIVASAIAAIPWFPGAYRGSRAVPHEEKVMGISVRHPRYLNIPKLGMRAQPEFLARAILRDLASAGMRRDDFDVVDAHYFYPDGVAAAAVARALDLPLVITARGSDINLIGEIAFARRRMVAAAHGARALIAVSRALATRMEAMGMPVDRIHVLRNGVDTRIFVPAPREDARRAIGVDENGAWVLGVGNLVPEKGFDLLIRAVSRLPDVRLLLVGDGPLREALQALANAGAPGRVEFRNNVPQAELRFHYAACDLLAVPSLREGWPNVILESIACGTPVVASAVGGIPEILPPGAPGMTLSSLDPLAWAEALRATLKARHEPRDLIRYAQKFGWEDVVASQSALYERVAGAGAPRRAPEVA